MKYLNKKEREEAGENYGWAALLKEATIKDGDVEHEIRLWRVGSQDGRVFEDAYLASEEEEGFWIYTVMNGCYGSAENLYTRSLVEACQAFNTIIQTMKA